MDPNKTLEFLNNLLIKFKQMQPVTQAEGESEFLQLEAEIKYYANTLDAWLDRGGFAPNWEIFPIATEYYNRRKEHANNIKANR